MRSVTKICFLRIKRGENNMTDWFSPPKNGIRDFWRKKCADVKNFFYTVTFEQPKDTNTHTHLYDISLYIYTCSKIRMQNKSDENALQKTGIHFGASSTWSRKQKEMLMNLTDGGLLHPCFVLLEMKNTESDPLLSVTRDGIYNTTLWLYIDRLQNNYHMQILY